MDYQRFYRELYAPLEAQLAPIDPNTQFAIIGFDAGGPLNFCTIGIDKRDRFVTYVSCELAVRREQVPSEFGRYELLCTCDDVQWVRSMLTKLGRMSLSVRFGHWHTVDIGPAVKDSAPIQGVLFEKQCEATIDGESCGILRVIGITRDEMESKRAFGSAALVEALQSGGAYPRTTVDRASVV